jgi:peptidoglycan/LPS O-acetylase OafA/YrhL
MNLEYYTDNQVWLWTYLQNWLFVFVTPYGDNLLLYTWSLAVEEQFYLVWPFIILLIRRPKILLAITLVMLVVIGIARYMVWIYQVEDLAYSSLYTFTRIDGLCIGSALALLMAINPKFLGKYITVIVLLMAAINFGFYFINTERSFTLPYLAFIGYTTFAMLFGILVYEAVTGESKWINFVFKNRLLIFFGKISYGLYVFHWPVYMLLFPATRNWILSTIGSSERMADMMSATLVTIAAVLLGVLSYRYFEKPFLKLKTRFE